jgi:hypothetical protein
MPPPLPPGPALARAVRQLREAQLLTQEELASRAGTTLGTVSRFESAKSHQRGDRARYRLCAWCEPRAVPRGGRTGTSTGTRKPA